MKQILVNDFYCPLPLFVVKVIAEMKSNKKMLNFFISLCCFKTNFPVMKTDLFHFSNTHFKSTLDYGASK